MYVCMYMQATILFSLTLFTREQLCWRKIIVHRQEVYNLASPAHMHIFKKSNEYKNTNGILFSAKKMSPSYWSADQPCYNVIFYLRRTEHKY